MHAISLNEFRLFIDQMHAKCMHFATTWSIFFQRDLSAKCESKNFYGNLRANCACELHCLFYAVGYQPPNQENFNP